MGKAFPAKGWSGKMQRGEAQHVWELILSGTQ